MQINFGVGTIVAKRTDITNQQPAFLGVVQDIEVHFDQTLKELLGSNKIAVDVAPAQLKISGKAKFAQIQATTVNNLLLGGTLVSGTSGFDLVVSEQIVQGATTTFTVAHGAQFLEDFGLFYAATNVALVPVPSAPNAGQYIPGAASVGTYTINAADESKTYNVFYSYTVTTLNQITLTNLPMGQGPVFEMFLSAPYTVQGVVKKFNLKLNAVRAAKMSMAFKNQDYTVPEMDFQAFADASGTVLTWALTE